MTGEQLTAILAEHEKWCMNGEGKKADLPGANLSGALLSKANLCGANLQGANLYAASLRGANLCGANLSDANLHRASLRGANLHGANLDGTVLDPNNAPNGQAKAFKTVGHGRVLGYRTRTAGHIDQCRDGRYYSADVFSVDDTECHPGLYLWPTRALAEEFAPHAELIAVETEPACIHKAGSKWRCQWFYVRGDAEAKSWTDVQRSHRGRRYAENELIDAMDGLLFDGSNDACRVFHTYITWRREIAKEAVENFRQLVEEEPGLLEMLKE